MPAAASSLAKNASGDVRVGIPAGVPVWTDVSSVTGQVHSDLQGAGEPAEGQDYIELRAKTGQRRRLPGAAVRRVTWLWAIHARRRDRPQVRSARTVKRPAYAAPHARQHDHHPPTRSTERNHHHV